MGLFKPKWKSEKTENRIKWIESADEDINKDLEILEKLAITDPQKGVRIKAVEKISNQKILSIIAQKAKSNFNTLKDDEPREGLIALNKITDKELQIEIAKNSIDRNIRKTTVKQISVKKKLDELILAEIAMNEEEGSIIDDIIRKISNKEILLTIVRNYNNYEELRKKAFQKLTPAQSILSDIIKNDPSKTFRLLLLEKISDQKILKEIAENDHDENVREAAKIKLTGKNINTKISERGQTEYDEVDNIINQNTLIEIVKNNEDETKRNLAFNKLTDQSLAKIADSHNFNDSYDESKSYHLDHRLIKKAISKITNQEILENLAVQYSYLDNGNDISESIVERLQPAIIKKHALNTESRLRTAAFRNLKDEAVLIELLGKEYNEFYLKLIFKNDSFMNLIARCKRDNIQDLEDYGINFSESAKSKIKQILKESESTKSICDERVQPQEEKELYQLILDSYKDEPEERDISSINELYELTKMGIQNELMAKNALPKLLKLMDEYPDFDMPVIWVVTCYFKLDRKEDALNIIEQKISGLKRKTELCACFAPELFHWALDLNKKLSVSDHQVLLACCIGAYRGNSFMYFGKLFLADLIEQRGLGSNALITNLRKTHNGMAFYGDYQKSVFNEIRQIVMKPEIEKAVKDLAYFQPFE